MNLIEIVPAHSREHRRVIREMTREPFHKGAMPMNPQAAALVEMGFGALAGLIVVAVARLFVWRLTGV